ncbi:hypothetical protein [Laspinema olomoucense]|uniref:hypothetical protein n=1 Tax=Laspinema olomoucense TaxID=3231600 RepID=UPI0021BBA4C9|nr:hypothetical protein [Laspinema sp. D3c]MCT7992918.1 hypothetical protein [Laspinema sp. D3c]
MSDRSPKASPAPVSPEQGLKPVLAAVLESLDVKLESELTRYRRQKRGDAVQPSYSGNGLTPPQKTAVDLITLSPSSTSSQQSPSLELPSAQTLKFEALKPMPGPNAAETPSAAVNGSENQPLGIPAIATSGDNGIPGTTNGIGLSTESPGAIVGATQGSDSKDPHEYLDSSEKLVSSLDQENAKKLAELRARRKTRSQNSFLSPLGIGSMLLFVAASGTLAYVVTQMGEGQDPATRQQANLGRNANNQVPESGSTNEAPITPDLTNSQFKPLDLGNLGTLEEKPPVAVPAPSPQGSVPSQTVAIAPTVTPNPAPGTSAPASPGLRNLTTDYLAGSGQPVVTQPATGTAPTGVTGVTGVTGAPGAPGAPGATGATGAPGAPGATAVTGAPGAPATGVSPASFPGFYYVVMDYQNEESLWKAREVVPDAYLREYPIGVKIQVAAFEDQASAQAMLEQMKQQGITGQIYKP